MSVFIECRQLVKAFQVGGHEVVALRGLDFEMARGEMVAIIGPSGAGKSTMLNLLGGLDRPTAGQLTVDGRNLLELRERQLAHYRLRQVGFIWQEVDRNLMSYRPPLANVTLPMMLAGVPLWTRRKHARELLNAVGMLEYANKPLVRLSGGQQQRVAVAVALANQPDLLLADEPTGSLDRATATQVMQLITALRERYGLTVLMATHDLEIANYADRVLTLRDGALGQDLSGSREDRPVLESDGRLRLPETARSQLVAAESISVEIRPEGVLLRSESEAVWNADTSTFAQEILEQDAPPAPNRLPGRLFRWLRRRKRI